MSDPIALPLAITKAVWTAGEICWATGTFIANTVKAPTEISIVKEETNSIETILRRLQPFILEDTDGIWLADDIRVEDVATVVSRGQT